MDKAVYICTFVWFFYFNDKSVIGKEHPMFQKPSGSHWGGSVHQRWLNNARMSSLSHCKSSQQTGPQGCPEWPTHRGNVTHASSANLQQVYQKCAPVWNTKKHCCRLKIPYSEGPPPSFLSKGCLQESVPWPCFSAEGDTQPALRQQGMAPLSKEQPWSERGKKVWQCRCMCDVMEHFRTHLFEHRNIGNFKTDTTLETGLVDIPHSTRPRDSTPEQTIPVPFLPISGN